MTEDHATLGYLVTAGAIIKSEGRVEWGDAICAAGSKIYKYEARIAALEAALKPFAYDYGDYSDGMWSDLDYIQVSVGDLRAARAAMEGK